MRLLSICTGMGLFDRAMLDAGHEVVPGCEIDPLMREMYAALCPGPRHLVHDLADLPAATRGQHFDGVIGGPSCQSHSKLRAMRVPKFPDLTPLVRTLLDAVSWDFFLFENVVGIDIPDAAHTRLNAMHFDRPHQSRVRWFTHSPDLKPPRPLYKGGVDDLMAYPVVAGRIYGPKRGAVLQGYPAAAALPFPCVQLQLGLANAVPYGLGRAWADRLPATEALLW